MDNKRTEIVGIVTFNPDIERLNENLDAVLKQSSNVVIIDNGSDNYDDFIKVIDRRVVVIHNESNEGIASALCSIMDYARDNGFTWVLTLDQDSVIVSGLIDVYLHYSADESFSDVAAFTCLIKDRNYIDEKYEKQLLEVVEVPYCITSATFMNVEKYYRTKGYDRSFFIDAVDFDICYSLRECGYRLCRVNFEGLYHEVGHGENRFFLGKKIVVYHQTPMRIYYFARNMIIMSKKHRKLFPWFSLVKKELALFMRIVLYEDNRSEKLKFFFKGVRES